MPRMSGRTALRAMTLDDVADVIAVQEPGAVRGLAEVFPQDTYPFPRDEVAARWRQEIATPGIDCFVVLLDDTIAGFAAIRGDEFVHFGIAVGHWGGHVAQDAHDAVLDILRERGLRHVWLTVFTKNGRGRRFYEKLGWKPTGDRTRGTFAPYPELLRYERSLEN